MGRSRTMIATSLGLAVVVGLLALVGWVGLARMRGTVEQVNEATARLAGYQRLQHALAQQAFAEMEFRKEPSEAARDALLEAVADLDVANDEVRATGTVADRVAAGKVSVLNRVYEGELRGARAWTPGEHLMLIQQVIDDAMAQNTRDLQRASDNQAAALSRMAWRAPLALLICFGLLGGCWVALVRYGRRAAARAAVNERLALEDPLTGLGNRRALGLALAPELTAEHADSAVLLLDLDRFKEINDTWGHNVGDEVLKTVAERLTHTVRSTDLVARLGGDEFAVLVRPAAHAEVLRERLHAAVSAPMQVGGVLLQPGGSIGLATVQSGQSQEDVLRAADHALYELKRELSSVLMLGERRAAR